MLDFGIVGVILERELSSPDGKREILKFLSSPKGRELLQEFFKSPDAKPIAGKLLMPILTSLGVPDNVKQPMEQYIPL
jgi:hypothetical protein